MRENLFVKRISADEAFERLEQLFKFAEHFGKHISDEQRAYCEEWLFDCVHETGDCPINTPLEILNESFDEFREEVK